MIKRLCIIGVGLIGGSLARALRRANACEEVVGCGRNTANLDRAVELGVIDRYETDIGEAVQGADVVVVAVPLGSMEMVFSQMKDHLERNALITDVGSAKGSVADAGRKIFADTLDRFVPAHPIAGTEKSGVEASFAELFDNRRVIITPLEESSKDSVERVRNMWEQSGAEVMEMPIEHHDEVLAATSHLPHILAFSLVDTLANMRDHDEIFEYAAGGFRDFTRIASSDPIMWKDICVSNRQALLEVMKLFRKDLDHLTDLIQNSDEKAIEEIFTRAKQSRDRYTDGCK